jgi:nitroreductase
MQIWEAIRSRRNVRSFTDRPIHVDHLDEICEAGRRAPSAQNWQPWDFVLVTERDRLTELARTWPGGQHVAGSAATIVLAAAGLAIGSGHSSVGDKDLAREILGLPADKVPAYMIALGYPADRPLTLIRHPDRRPLDEIVHREHW